MKKFLDWYIQFYPTSGCPQPRRVAIHFTYWVVWWFFTWTAMAGIGMVEKLIFTIPSAIQSATIYYGLTYFAFPNLLVKRKIIIGILLCFLVYLITYAENLPAYGLDIRFHVFKPNSYMLKYAQTYLDRGIWGAFNPDNFLFELYNILNAITVPFILKFSRVISEYYTRNERLLKEKTDIEIDFLRTQLNPHFLLNSLNNIYSQVVSQDETAGNSIIILSDLMKYILYNSSETLVDLEREIRFLRDYIDLEKLRGNRYLKINFSQEGEMKGYKIAPLILINYVENAFKHGGRHHGEVSSIDIDIKFIDETLYVRIENDYVEKTYNGNKSKEGGVGIANTRRRLKLLYPNRHKLTINKANNKFLVEIMVTLFKE